MLCCWWWCCRSCVVAGSLNRTGARLLAAFEQAFEAEAAGGCPSLSAALAANQTSAAEPWSPEHQVVGVELMTLYTITHANGSMVNANSADAAGAAAAVLLASADLLAAVPLPRLHVSARITEVKAAVNTLFGDFTACTTSSSSAGTWAASNLPELPVCAPTWDCLCEPPEDDGGDPPHCQTKDPGNPCECAVWGGCRGDPQNNAGVVSVGWRKLAGSSSALGGGGAPGNVYSTMAAGECRAGRTAPNSFEVCTWQQVSTGRAADRTCLEAQLRQRLPRGAMNGSIAAGAITPALQPLLAAAWAESWASCL
eukprot:SAG22_NODE_1917_length_3316_cov_4.498912_2_plen_311_part_00